MPRQGPRYKGETLKDHHDTRRGDRADPLPKAGAGKGNWGTEASDLDELGIRVGSPFEDPKLSPSLEANESKVRVASEEEISLTVG